MEHEERQIEQGKKQEVPLIQEQEIIQTENQFITLKEGKKINQSMKKLIYFDGSISQGKTLRINSVTEKEKELYELLSDIESVKVNNFQISQNNAPLILNKILHINFINIKNLSLFHDQISSFQHLYKISLPLLETLRLDQNKSISLRSLKKCYWPSLKQIDLQNNFWSDPHYLTQMYAPKIATIRLQDWGDKEARNDDKSWMAKIQSEDLNYIRCPNSNRQLQREVQVMLKKKYPKITFMNCHRN